MPPQGTVLIKTAQELKDFSRGEESQLEDQIKAIAATGAKVRGRGTSGCTCPVHRSAQCILGSSTGWGSRCDTWEMGLRGFPVCRE